MKGSLSGQEEMIMAKVKPNWKQTVLSVVATIAVASVFKLMQEQLLKHVDEKIDQIR